MLSGYQFTLFSKILTFWSLQPEGKLIVSVKLVMRHFYIDYGYVTGYKLF